MAGLKKVEKHRLRFLLLILISIISLSVLSCAGSKTDTITVIQTVTEISKEEATTVKLPEPRYSGDVSLEETLLRRRSVRNYTGEPLAFAEVSQLLWAAQGITSPAGFRTAPSAGGLYPLDLYTVVGNVENLVPGIYRYSPQGHQLFRIKGSDRRAELAEAALGQSWVLDGSVSFVFIGVYQRTTEKYGDRGIRYVHFEAGHAAQNLCLQAAALGLGSVTVGAFDDNIVTRLFGLPEEEQPLYIIPVGRK
jgi:SagB-type dehydrogenase family enzyme